MGIEARRLRNFYRAFRNSKLTLNLSRANGARLPHAKTRILEASLFGSVLVTDNKRWTQKILPENAFVYFRTLRDLTKQVASLTSDPDLLDGLQIASSTASLDCMYIFWREFQQLNGLRDFGSAGAEG